MGRGNLLILVSWRVEVEVMMRCRRWWKWSLLVRAWRLAVVVRVLGLGLGLGLLGLGLANNCLGQWTCSRCRACRGSR